MSEFDCVPNWQQLYLEALLDGYHAARSRASHACAAAADACADALVPFLARRFDDPCIVSPDLRDQLLQTVSLLLQSPPLLARFEASPDARAHLVLLSLNIALITVLVCGNSLSHTLMMAFALWLRWPSRMAVYML